MNKNFSGIEIQDAISKLESYIQESKKKMGSSESKNKTNIFD